VEYPPVACDPVATTTEVLAARVKETAEARRIIKWVNIFIELNLDQSSKLARNDWESIRFF
jgi:hypothetical protein